MSILIYSGSIPTINDTNFTVSGITTNTPLLVGSGTYTTFTEFCNDLTYSTAYTSLVSSTSTCGNGSGTGGGVDIPIIISPGVSDTYVIGGSYTITLKFYTPLNTDNAGTYMVRHIKPSGEIFESGGVTTTSGTTTTYGTITKEVTISDSDEGFNMFILLKLNGSVYDNIGIIGVNRVVLENTFTTFTYK